MRLLRQLEFALASATVAEIDGSGRNNDARNVDLEERARELLRANGAGRIAMEIRVEWNPRLKTCAGRADYRSGLISLNPQLAEHPAEIDRTLRHELAHILAQFRAGRRRILPHTFTDVQIASTISLVSNGSNVPLHAWPVAALITAVNLMHAFDCDSFPCSSGL